MELLSIFFSYIETNPMSILTLVGLIVVIVFQMAQSGILNIKIGKDGGLNTKKNQDKDVYQAQIDDITQDIADLKNDVKVIKDNHLAHIQADMTMVKEAVAFIKGKLSK